MKEDFRKIKDRPKCFFFKLSIPGQFLPIAEVIDLVDSSDELMPDSNHWNDRMGNKGPCGQMNSGNANNGDPPVPIESIVQLHQRLHNQVSSLLNHSMSNKQK
jgi:hypothetical protein